MFESVKSDDKADIQQLIADIKALTEAVEAYRIDSVKSTDRENIEALKNEIEALKATGNVTEEEKAALDELLSEADVLTDRIDETEEKLEEITDFKNSYDIENVTSDDKAAIDAVIEEINSLNHDNLTDGQKAAYNVIRKELLMLNIRVAKTLNKVEAVELRLNKFPEERVTIFWEDDINELIEEIDVLLADENMGETEKATLNEYKAEAEKLLEIINTPAEYISARFFYFIWDFINFISGTLTEIFNTIFSIVIA